ncbi:MAG: hypothetical protein Q8P11_04145 [bacterium]|nr:hypothetical protein [bacterium]
MHTFHKINVIFLSVVIVFGLGFIGILGVQDVDAQDTLCSCAPTPLLSEGIVLPPVANDSTCSLTCGAYNTTGVPVSSANAPVFSTTPESQPMEPDSDAPPTYIPLPNPLAVHSPAEFVNIVVNAFLGLTGSVALVVFIYGGITWMISEGEPEKIKKGLDTMIWAGIGMGIIFSSYAIVKFVIDAVINI